MSYYENTDAYHAKGIDYDLWACLCYNKVPFEIEDIDRVLAVYEGYNDGDDWRWIIRLQDERYVYLRGGCDYTGWDCQSWASAVFEDSPFKALEHEITGDVPITESNSPIQAGTEKMLNVLAGTYNHESNNVYATLHHQLEEGKNKTWREKKDVEFGLASDDISPAS